MIYFDNAATSFPKPASVIAAIIDALNNFGNAGRASHPYSLIASRTIEEARSRLALLFHCPRPERIAFTKNATEAINFAVHALDGHLVTTAAEHNALLRPLYHRGNFAIAPIDEQGLFGVENIARQCRSDTRAILVSHASNLTGNIAPLEAIGRFCRERGILFVVDAAQTAGLFDIDMEKLGIDALCFTGHKALYGPQGTGGIAMSERFQPRPLLFGGGGNSFNHEQPPQLPDVLEVGTQNAHGIAGLLAGVRYVQEEAPAKLLARANALAKRFIDGVGRIEGVTLYGDLNAPDRAPVVALNVGRRDSSEVAEELETRYGIAVRPGMHCAPLLHKKFITDRQGAVRFSFSHFNSEAEIDLALKALGELA